MSELDGRLKLETINYNQVGWHSIHNTNIEKLNSFIEGLAAQDPVLDKDLSTPPISPSIGDRYIVGSSGTGDWSDKDEQIAEWNGVEWRFTAPINGTHCYVLDEAVYYLYNEGVWEIHPGLAQTDHGDLTGLEEDDHTQYYNEERLATYLSSSNGTNDFRLTLTSGTPVTTSDVTSAGTLYLTPFTGNRIALYNGTNWKFYTSTEKSLALTLTSGKNYDVFVYDNAGTLTLELSAEWTNDSTRADSLAIQDGIYVKSGATTRRWLGTIRASGTNTTEDSVSKRYVWNKYNQIDKILFKKSSSSHTYNSTIRWWNNTSTNYVSFVCGEIINVNQVTLSGAVQGAANGIPRIAVGYNSTASGIFSIGHNITSVVIANTVSQTKNHLPTVIGYSYYSALEYETASQLSTFPNFLLDILLKC